MKSEGQALPRELQPETRKQAPHGPCEEKLAPKSTLQATTGSGDLPKGPSLVSSLHRKVSTSGRMTSN